MSSDPITVSIKECLATLKQPRQSSFYAAIVGPSLMGKTQTAFSLCHCMNVLYYNLYVGDESRAQETQAVYEPFRSFSLLLTKVIDQDLKNDKLSFSKMNAASFRNFGHSFYTLGFIYTYLKMKTRMRPDSNSVKEWLYELVQYEKAFIPALTRSQFTQRISSGNTINRINNSHSIH